MEFSVSIGDIKCSVNIKNEGFIKILKGRYKYFLTQESADYKIMVNIKPINELLVNKDLSDKPIIKINKEDGVYFTQRIDNPFLARIDKRHGIIEVDMWESQYCFDSFLRILYIALIEDEKGLLLHSCSIDDNGQGRVFFGPSEAGKTTIARLADGRKVLSDELSLIRPVGDKYYVYGTPFWGEFRSGKNNCRAELSGLYALEKSEQIGLSLTDKVTAINKLYRCILYFGNSTEISSHILQSCYKLVHEVPVYNMNFRKDKAFWKTINIGGS